MSVALGDVTALEGGLQDGFCRSDFNYCMGQELMLRAETTAAAPLEPEVRVELLRVARERLQAAAAEYVSSLAWYTGACETELADYGFECVRLEGFSKEDAGYAPVAVSRLTDAIDRIQRLVDLELTQREQLGDALSQGADTDEPADLIPLVWGEEGQRTLGVSAVYGQPDGVAFSGTLNDRAGAGVALPIALEGDERAASALSLLSNHEVPVGLARLAKQPSSIGTGIAPFWEEPAVVDATYNLLDHRMAAAELRGPYSDPGSSEGEALRRHDPMSWTEFMGFETDSLAAGISPLREDAGLRPDDIANGMRLMADTIEVNDVERRRVLQVTLGSLNIYGARLGQSVDRSPLRLAAPFSDDDFSDYADALQERFPPMPRTGVRVRGNWYGWGLRYLDGTQSQPIGALGVEEHAPAPLGGAQILHLLRVHLLRVASLDSPFASPEDVAPALELLDRGLGTSWTEVDGSTDAVCLCSVFADCDVSEDPLYAPCVDCDPCFTSFFPLDDAAHWDVYFEEGDRFETGTPVMVTQWAAASCLIRDRIPGETAPCDVTPTALAELGSGSFAEIERERRRFSIDLTLLEEDVQAKAYILWPSDDGRFDLVDVVKPRRGASVHPLGGRSLERVAGSWSRDPWRPAEPAVASVGQRASLVPPLEHELISDEDRFEDSFRRYLDEAHTAAGTAATQLERARRMELQALLEDRSTEAELEAAELAETEAVSDLCGTSGECEVERVSDGTTLADLGVVQAVPPPVDECQETEIDDGTCNPDMPRVLGCMGVLEDVFSGFFIPEGEGAQRAADVVENHLQNSLRCARFLVVSEAAELTIDGLPQPAADELAAGGTGNFSDFEGQLREELITAFQTLADLRALFRRLNTQVAAAERFIKAAATEVKWHTTTDRERRLCKAQFWLGNIADLGEIALSAYGLAEAADSKDGYRALGEIQSAAGSMASLGSRTEAHASSGGCANDFAAEDGAAESLQQLSSTVQTLRELGQQAQGKVATLFALSGRLDGVATEAGLARSRRGIAERLATTTSLADQPEWRALSAFTARRAKGALERAKQAAFVARRAIEFRLGVSMPSMLDPEPFTPPPALWCDDIFATDFGSRSVPSEDGEDPTTVSVSAEQIVDYVNRLERFVDGYGFDRRFRDSSDTQVINLTAVLGVEVGEPIHEKLIYRCEDHPDPLPGGRLEGTGEGPPCEGLGA
ncbi:MAG: hypothetical protein ACOCUS_00425, partial [Polyangiales bacterium]